MNKMKEFIIFSFLLAFRSVVGVGQYRKCCKDGQALDSNRQCTSEGTGPSSILDLAERYQPGFELIGVGFPDCSYTEAFQFNISSKFTQWTNQGLQVAKYSKIFEASEYCLDFFEDQVYAVTCDLCKAGLPCFHLCCPFGNILELPEYDYEDEESTPSTQDIPSRLPRDTRTRTRTRTPALMNTRAEFDILPNMNERPLPEDYNQIQQEDQINDICKPILQAQNFTGMLKIFQNRKQLSWREGVNYHLVAPKQDFFQCPVDPITKEIASLTALDGDPILLGTGGLDGVIDSNDENGRIIILPPETFCLSVNDPDPVFLQCVFSPEPDKCEAIRFWVFNCAFILSILFIILAIIAHFIEPLLKNTALGTLSIGFLFNLLMTYIIMLISRLATFERETPSCVFIGYLQQYFYLSFFTWNNAIAIIIGQKLTTSRIKDSKKKQIVCFIYAQGLPAVICVLTYIIDLFVPEEGPNRAYFPEMGVYSCYLGSERTAVRPHYFLSPDFLYVQGFQLLLLLINLAWFVRAAIFIVKNRTTVGESDVNKQRENYVIVLKLFIHMCSLWICEIITSAIAVEHGVIETCQIRFILDSPNAFYGLLIFIFLIIGKKAVRKNLQETVSSWFSSSKEINTEVGYSTNGGLTENSKVILKTKFKK